MSASGVRRPGLVVLLLSFGRCCFCFRQVKAQTVSGGRAARVPSQGRLYSWICGIAVTLPSFAVLRLFSFSGSMVLLFWGICFSLFCVLVLFYIEVDFYAGVRVFRARRVNLYYIDTRARCLLKFNTFVR